MEEKLHPPKHGTAEAAAMIKEPAALPQLTNEEFRIITDSAIDGIVVMDNYGRVTHWNPAAEKIFGWKAEDILGRSIHDTITPPEFREASYKGIARFLKTGQGPLLGNVRTVTGLRKDGSLFPLEISLSAFKINGRWWATAFTRDVTERHEAEQEMQNYAAALVEANKNLREMRERAEKAVESKSRFLANMSHEIRTPLNGIMGFTSLLLDTDLDHEQLDYTYTIHKSGELLLQTINNILDFSKIEAGQLQLENTDFNLKSTIGNLIALLSIKSNEKKIQLRMNIDEDVPLLLRGDPLRISQILLNLMSNAVKFTEKGQVSVDVHAGSITPQKADLLIYVSDTGIGIPADRIDSLFEPFTQADASTTRKFGGTGLGLTICHRLVELMGGQICVCSPAVGRENKTYDSNLLDQEGPGTTFAIALSLMRQVEIEGKLGEQEPSKQTQPFDRQIWEREPIHARALIAEDNPVNQKLLSQILKKFGVQTVAVMNGQEAIKALQKEDFDILMMDFEMPLLNGIETTRVIRSGGTVADTSIPIVILTAHAMKEDRMICIASGANEYLTKPFHPDKIYQTLLKLLGPTQNHRTKPTPDASSPEEEEESMATTNNYSNYVDEPLAYDAKELLEQCGNDPDLVSDLIEIFLDSHDEMVAAIAETIHHGSPEMIAKAVHKIKGSLHVLHADEACQEAIKLESMALEGKSIPVIREQFTNLREKLQILLRQLETPKTVR